MDTSLTRSNHPPLRRWAFLAAGPVAALLVAWLVPAESRSPTGEVLLLGSAGRATLAMMAWMAVWWMTEATDITVTSLLPIALFPLLGVAPLDATLAPYADEIVFLFLGGFLLSLSMQRWGLDRRMALTILSLFGSRPASVMAGFMLVTAVISAFVSNVATTAMMLPIAVSVIGIFDPGSSAPAGRENGQRFATGLSLAIAYASSIGGMTTIIGSPPNAILVGFLRSTGFDGQSLSISFLQWMAFGVPLAVVLLGLVWLLLTQVFFAVGSGATVQDSGLISRQLRELGPVQRGEWVTATVFGGTALLWVFNPWLTGWEWGSGYRPLAGLGNTVVVMSAALLLFLIPVPRREGLRGEPFVMDWATANQLPWNVLLLFGGGLSLAEAVRGNGVAEYLGNQLHFLAACPTWLVVAVIVAIVIFLGELTSNTATTASLLPVLVGLAPVVQLHPALLAVAVTLAASCSFMLPVGTPPNALVYATGRVTIGQMTRVGVWINLACVLLITLLVFQVVPWALGLSGAP